MADNSITYDCIAQKAYTVPPPANVAISQASTPSLLLPLATPDIAGIITALTSSPSIDQPTKNALIAALKGR